LKALFWPAALASAFIGGAIVAHYYSFAWLAALSGLAAIFPTALFTWRAIQAFGAKRLWEPGAARALARIVIGAGVLFAVHFTLKFAGFSAFEKLLSILASEASSASSS